MNNKNYQLKKSVKHSAGPWKIELGPVINFSPSEEDAYMVTANTKEASSSKDRCICLISPQSLFDHEDQANMNVIMTSPKMLLVLKKIAACKRGEGLPVDVVLELMNVIEEADPGFLDSN